MSGISYCLICLVKPNRVCQYCGMKYASQLDHFCEGGEKHMFGQCSLRHYDSWEGRSPGVS